MPRITKIQLAMIDRTNSTKFITQRSIAAGIILVGFFVLTGSQVYQDTRWVAPPEADSYENPLRDNTKATEKGAKIYMKLCWTCHGKAGNGDGPAAVALQVTPSDYTTEEVQSQSDGALYWKISTGRGEMVAYQSSLTDDQRWMLVNYIRKLGDPENMP